MAKPKALILSGYGINCEEETAYAFQKYGANPEIVHVNDLIDGLKKFEDYQILAIPGGFAYGDDTGAGKAMANRIANNLREAVLKFVQKDKLAIGICNGFQVLTALGLAPALDDQYGERQSGLMANDNNRYTCRWVHLKTGSKKCVWTKGVERLYIPIAHGEGYFYMPEEKVKELQTNDQVVFTYTKEDGSPAGGEYPYNPNGSILDIAGICDGSGRVLGLMPHPERHLFFHNHPDFTLLKEKYLREDEALPQEGEGGKVFKNAVNYFSG
ncbi:phosphoribosylformylglycinamidine synthase I [Candidatus Peregrinibacteria bacterium]|nr:phosphoribosylformylglycinamidine synthase I [Candidatus Peregrinibacteria bacterium]